MAYIDDWKKVISQVRFNPHAIQRTALNALRAANNGQLEITDPSNPFAFLLESSAVNASAIMEHSEGLNRKAYPVMALTEEEIYTHMSDEDFIGRFSTPSRAKFHLMFDKAEIYARAVLMPDGKTKKITIPANTRIKLGDVHFTMQYPIDIRTMAHGGLQITYNNDRPSPLLTLTSNLVEWNIVRYQDKERVDLVVPFEQLSIKRHVMKLTLSSAATSTFTFDNQFYYARVYRALPNGQWQEIYTTHTDQVFNPTRLTAVLKVINNRLTVSIPQVYLTTGLIDSEIRVDVYTTLGNLNLDLEGYEDTNFVVEWTDSNQTPEESIYSAPLQVFNEYWTFSGDVTSGGHDALPFDVLRNRVIDNAIGNPDEPISNAQLTTRLEDMGYSVVKNIDNITNREFLATRVLPRPTSQTTILDDTRPTNQTVISGAGCTIRSLSATMEELTSYRTVKDNGNRITLMPDTLYQDTNGVVSVVSDVAVDALLALPPDIRARRVNESRYMYSPFHYVLDMTNDRFDHRGYYLDNPKVESIAFIDENDTTGYSVGTDRVEIERLPQGYRLLVRTRSTDNWKTLTDVNVHCQMAFNPVGEKDLAYLNGTLIGRTSLNERLYEFILTTDYDINVLDQLYLTSFQMYNDPPREHATALSANFSIFYLISDIIPDGYVQSPIDRRISKLDLPPSTFAVTEDLVSVTLGTALTGLWTASRSFASSQDYLRYLNDVPNLHTETIYLRDPVTGVIDITIDGSGNLNYTVLHEKGSPVLDQNGQPTFRHRKGDVVLDIDDNPIIVSSRRLQRMVDILFIDGAYWFATESISAQYQAEIPRTIVSWLSNDIIPVSKYLLEQTHVYFYPKSTLGFVEAIVRENERVMIRTEQSFSVTFYLSSVKYRDTALRKALSRMAVSAIYDSLQSNVVTADEINRRIRETAGSDVIAVSVTGLGGDVPLDVITLVDDSARLSIRKIARALEDNTIGVFDDVSISFIQHTA